jgi:hypothetical protein
LSAPLPRPPQPISATLNFSEPAANTFELTAIAADIAAVVLMKSLRERPLAFIFLFIYNSLSKIKNLLQKLYQLLFAFTDFCFYSGSM